MRISTIVCLCALALPLAACGGGGGGGGNLGNGGGGGGGGGGNQLPPIHVVTNLNDAGAGSLRDAIANAPAGAWIVFDTNLATGMITLNSPLVIDRSTVIGGLTSTFDRMTISGDGAHRIFDVQPGRSLDLRDLILSDGNAGGNEDGGAIRAVEAPIRLTRVTIASCHAPLRGGGAIYQAGSTLEMTDCAVTACTASLGGGLQLTRVKGTIDRCSFYLNTATNAAGGAMSIGGGNLKILSSTITGNQAASDMGDGAGISLIASMSTGSALLWLRASTVTNNTAGDVGGGLLAREYDGRVCSVYCDYSIIADNAADVGPDIHFEGGAGGNGGDNLIGVRDNANAFKVVDDNQVGELIAPLDPELAAVSFHSYGRAMHLPLAGSPAVDAISEASLEDPFGDPIEIDQRGDPRVKGAAPDKGAIER